MVRKVSKKADVVIVGGGPGGIPAAIAAARMGKQAILIERNSFLGGAAASGLGILGYLDRQGNKALGGIAQEIIDRMKEYGAETDHYRCPVHNSITPITPDVFKMVSLDMCLEAGVEVIFNQEITDVRVVNGKVEEIEIYGKCTKTTIEGKVFIDATGDGDLAYLAGAKFQTGQDKTSVMQPCTLMFTVTDYSLEELFQYLEKHPEDFGIKEEYAKGYSLDFFRNTKGHCFIGLQNLIEKAKSSGEFDIPRNQFIYITSPKDDLLAINTTRIVKIDSSDPYELNEGLIEGYRQISVLMKFMNKYVPGFSNAHISQISPNLGIRETRHFKGKTILKEETQYSDETMSQAIALCAYNIDIHSGTNDGIDLTVTEHPFGIPYGCLVPADLDGLLLSGRTISVDTKCYAAARVMGPCMAVGEAAGIAASIAIDNKVSAAEIDVNELRNEILKKGGILKVDD